MIAMAVKRVGTVYAVGGKKKDSNPVGVVIVGILMFAWIHYYGEFVEWFSERTGGPARYVEQSAR